LRTPLTSDKASFIPNSLCKVSINFKCRNKITYLKKYINYLCTYDLTAPCIMFLMRADTIRGQVGGVWAPEMESFLDPAKRHRADRRVPFGAQSPPTCAENRSQSSHFSQHSVFVPILNNKLGKEISTLCYFFLFTADAAFFPVRYSSCFSFTSPSEDVYRNFYIFLPYWSSYLYVKVWRENKLQFLFPGARLLPELL
jgi:hypothetical protein